MYMSEPVTKPDGLATFEIKGTKQTVQLKKKDFRTGSRGYFASGKIELEDGTRLQVVCNLVIIGSKAAKQAAS
jgi:hypothetical protein